MGGTVSTIIFYFSHTVVATVMKKGGEKKRKSDQHKRGLLPSIMEQEGRGGGEDKTIRPYWGAPSYTNPSRQGGGEKRGEKKKKGRKRPHPSILYVTYSERLTGKKKKGQMEVSSLLYLTACCQEGEKKGKEYRNLHYAINTFSAGEKKKKKEENRRKGSPSLLFFTSCISRTRRGKERGRGRNRKLQFYLTKKVRREGEKR